MCYGFRSQRSFDQNTGKMQIKHRHLNYDEGNLKTGNRWTITRWVLPNDPTASLSTGGYWHKQGLFHSVPTVGLAQPWLCSGSLERTETSGEVVGCPLRSWSNEAWLRWVLRGPQAWPRETWGKAAAASTPGAGTSKARSISIPRRAEWQWGDRHVGLPFPSGFGQAYCSYP